MTAVPTGRAHRRARPIETMREADGRALDWGMIGVILAVLVQGAGVVWLASNMNARLASLEAQVPPGVIQRLDERTVQIQDSLKRLELQRP